MLGAFLKKTNCVSVENIHKALEKVFERYQKLIPLNIKALEVGMSYIK